MPSVEIAHVRTQNVNVIIVPLEREFTLRTPANQEGVVREISAAARGAGLDGAVTIVWEDSRRNFNFLGPRNQQAFYRGIDMRWVRRHLNTTLSW